MSKILAAKLNCVAIFQLHKININYGGTDIAERGSDPVFTAAVQLQLGNLFI